MKHFGRSLLNPTLATVLSTFANGPALAELASKVTPSSFKDYDGDLSQGAFCALDGNDEASRKANANSDIKTSACEGRS